MDLEGNAYGYDDQAGGDTPNLDHDDFELENNYSDEEFDEDNDVIETDAFIKYTAPIGPNIVISKTTPTIKKQHRFVKRATKVTTSSKAHQQQLHQVDSTISTISTVEQTVTSTCHHQIQSALALPLPTRKKPKNPRLSNEFHKLNLETSHLVPRRKANDFIREKSNVSLSTCSLNGFKTSRLQERLNSAKRLQISDLKNKVHVLENRMQDLTTENRTLKTLHLRNESALRKYEGKDADLPKMIQHHQNEVTTLQHCLRKAHGHARQYEDQLRSLNHKIYSLQSQNEKLTSLVRKNNLDERNSLEEKLKEANRKLAEAEHKLVEYMRRFELIEKNHTHQLHVEAGKLRTASKRLFEAEKEIDRLIELVRQKDKLLNYLRMRTFRETSIEPPGLRKMILEGDPQVSTYRRVFPTADMIEQKRIEDAANANMKSLAHDSATPERLGSRNKTVESINEIYDRIFHKDEQGGEEAIDDSRIESKLGNLKLVQMPEEDDFVKELIASTTKFDIKSERVKPQPESTYAPCGSQIAEAEVSEDNESNTCQEPGSRTLSALSSNLGEETYDKPTVSKLRSLYLDALKQDHEVVSMEPFGRLRLRNSAPPLIDSTKSEAPFHGNGVGDGHQLQSAEREYEQLKQARKSIDRQNSVHSTSSLEGGGDT